MTTTGRNRFEKYRNELESHLEKVNQKLEEEIRNMREKVKQTKQSISEKTNTEKGLKSTNDQLLKQIDEETDGLEEMSLKERKIKESTEKLERQMEEDQIEIKEIKKENSLFRSTLDQLTVKLTELDNQAKTEEIAGNEKGFKRQLEKAIDEQNTWRRRKAVQDGAIERIQKDISSAENSLKKLDDSLLREIERRVKLESETDELKKKCYIFKEENLGLEDEFEKLMKQLRETENESSKRAAEAKKSERKKRAVLTMNEEYLKELRNNLETTKKTYEEGVKHVKELRENKKNEEKEIAKLQQTLEDLQKLKGLDPEKEKETITQAKLIEERIKYYEKNRQNSIRNLIELKENMLKFFASAPSSKSSSRSNSATRLMAIKKNILGLKREENALMFKIERYNQTKDDNEQKLVDLQTNLDDLADELRRAESAKNRIRQDRTPIDSVTLDSLEDKLQKDLEARRSDLELQIQKITNDIDNENEDIEKLKAEVNTLTTKLTKFGPVDVANFHSEIDEKRKEERRLSNYYSNLLKKARQKQKELELCVVQRDSAVDRAQSLVYLNTSIRAERQSEIEQIKERIKEKRKELESVLVD